MGLYGSGNFRAAHQGYAHYKLQTSRLVAMSAVADPSLQGTVNTAIGVCSLPALNRDEGIRDVEGIGASRDLAKVPGLRTYTMQTRIEVANGTFLTYAIRDRSDPDKAGTVGGLQLLTIETGTDPAFGDGYAEQALDCLINSLSLDIAENQNLVADVEIWPAVALEQPSPATIVLPAADVLYWSNLTVKDAGGTDYHSILSRASVRVQNGLQRRGMRQQFGALGTAELAISRTCYKIVPLLEKLTLSYGLHDRLPSALRDTDDWAAVTLRAEAAGTGAGRKYVQVVVDHNYLNRQGRQQAPANQMLTWTVDTASYAVAITSGVTT